MRGIRQSDEFKRGRAGEQVVAGWLKQRECYVIPSYDYAGENGDKSPKLQGLWRGHPVPDLDVARNGTRFWVEVKTKDKPGEWLNAPGGPQYTHGIDLRLLEHYDTVQKISGCPCYLFIYEENTGWLLTERLDALGKPVSIGSDGRGKKIAFWFRTQFRELEQVGGGALCRASRRTTSSTVTRRFSARARQRWAFTTGAVSTWRGNCWTASCHPKLPPSTVPRSGPSD
jgi:hypothetical protein